MRSQRAMLILNLLLFTCNLLGQNKPNSDDAMDLLQGMFEPDSRTNMTFVNYGLCPPQYTNVISNTNLFTPGDEKLFNEILVNYKNVTTNSGPPGSVLIGLTKTNGYCVAHFAYTNSDAHEDITFADPAAATARSGGGYNEFISGISASPLARFRTKSEDGYDAIINPPDASQISTIFFGQIKSGKIDGLFVVFENDHCETLLRFVKGMAVGRWFEWDVRRDNSLLEIKIKSSLDYFQYMNREIKN